MRNIRKHENSIRRSLQTITGSLLTCARIHCGAKIEKNFGPIEVSFDDSIIVDTQAEKNMMLAEIAAGVVPAWKYMATFFDMSDEEAMRLIGTNSVDMGA